MSLSSVRIRVVWVCPNCHERDSYRPVERFVDIVECVCCRSAFNVDFSDVKDVNQMWLTCSPSLRSKVGLKGVDEK